MSPLIESLELGKVPRVVGTIITERFLLEWSENPRRLPCDLIELRLDGYPQSANWLAVGETLLANETPVFATLRLASEGGKWTGLDSDRWPMLEEGLRRLSGIDVEINSELAEFAAELAREKNKLCILSHHNFTEMPPVETMRQMIGYAHERGCVGKIAAAVNTPEDLAAMRSVLAGPWELPVCLIGMGPLGRDTRLSFPREGSCFTYGYLDTPGAPGQFSAAELMKHFGR